jgi:hypothetical protein
MTNRINNCCAPHLLADVASLFGSEFVMLALARR